MTDPFNFKVTFNTMRENIKCLYPHPGREPGGLPEARNSFKPGKLAAQFTRGMLPTYFTGALCALNPVLRLRPGSGCALLKIFTCIKESM